MEFVDDLLWTIVSYTTPGVSLDVLTSFVPKDTYNAGLWRRKSLVESKGLVVDDDVIQMVGDGRWYAYYLAQNKTYCGDVLEVKWSRGNVASTIKVHDVLYYEVLFDSDKHRITVVQYRDLSIKIKNKRVHGLNRKIRQVVYIAQPFDLLAILDEIGDVWLYSITNGTLEEEQGDPITRGTGVVTMHAVDYVYLEDGACSYSNPLMLLDRLGRLRLLGKTEYLVSPKVVSFLSVGYPDYASTNDGKLIQFTLNPFEWKYMPSIYGYKTNPDEAYLNEFITTKLIPVIAKRTGVGNKVVQYSDDELSAAYLTTDRTAYIRIKSRRRYDVTTLAIEQSKHRTQTVMLIQLALSEQNKARYIIVDPIQSE